MNVSDYIELALITIILAVCVTLGIGITAQTYKKVLNDKNVVKQDKNTRTIELTADSVDDKNMTYEDIILMVEIQDYQMSEPNEFTIAFNKTAVGTVELKERYREQLMLYSSQVGDYLKAISNTAVDRYEVYYALNGSIAGKDSDTFVIEVEE